MNRELNILSHVFTVAAQEWHIHLPWGNPVRLVSRPRVDDRELNILSHVFTVAAQEWHIHLPWGNPVRLVSRPRVDDKRERRLVGDEPSPSPGGRSKLW
ncbi:hypothetical protein [Acidiferrobacter sp. SPIII_3]|uniref:hypothetical protein n=1 Tax=Acidiferrobacter sp. SPIII_3 TaxID=1281578 RepID=UPI0011AB3602|nr:hypothetical protein [Acidiferrobacter sp. SPIII_3]